MKSKGTILVVDDEQALLRLMEQYLTRLGYEVEVCTSAPEALQRFRSLPSRYSLVLTDMRLPGMPGEELATEIVKLDPATPVIAASGYPVDFSKLPAGAGTRVRFLQKPFSPEMLVGLIKELLST